jgi:hypothetical protein
MKLDTFTSCVLTQPELAENAETQRLNQNRRRRPVGPHRPGNHPHALAIRPFWLEHRSVYIFSVTRDRLDVPAT